MAPALPTIFNQDVPFAPSYPHSWLRLLSDPPGTTGPGGIRLMFGVLRPDHQGHAVSAAAFARSKLVVPARPDSHDWTITAHRAEVLLPAHADDRLRDPRTLFEEVDRTLPPGGRALASYITLTWMPNRLHAQYEIGRALAARLVAEFGTPALCVQHVPALNGGDHSPHLHLLIVARRLTKFGMFGEPIRILGRDGGRQMVADRLADIVASGVP